MSQWIGAKMGMLRGDSKRREKGEWFSLVSLISIINLVDFKEIAKYNTRKSHCLGKLPAVGPLRKTPCFSRVILPLSKFTAFVDAN